MIMYWKIKSLHKALRNACLSYQREGSTIIYVPARDSCFVREFLLQEPHKFSESARDPTVVCFVQERKCYLNGIHNAHQRASGEFASNWGKELREPCSVVWPLSSPVQEQGGQPMNVCWPAEAGPLPGPRLWGCREDQSNALKLTKVSFVSSRISKGSLRL